MLSNQRLDRSQFLAAETYTVVEADRVKPEFGGAIITLDVHMNGLLSIRRIEKWTVGA